MIGEKPSLRKRILRAVEVLVVGILMWIVIPDYIGFLISKQIPASSLTDPTFVLVLGGILTGLQVAIALTEGTTASVPLESSLSIGIAYYIWAATNGGNLVFSIGDTRVVLGFQLLVVLVILPSLWSAVRNPLSFLVMRRASAAEPPATPSSP